MYSKLTPAEIERLAKVAEEAGEVLQVIGKILVHGWESRHPRKPEQGTNREHLEEELGNLQNAVDMMCRAEDVRKLRIMNARTEKRSTISKYLHHQPAEVL